MEGVRSPRRIALLWLDVYLLVSGLVLAVGGHLLPALVHAAVITLAASTISPKTQATRFLGDFIPLIVTPILYAEIPLLIATLGSTYHDTLIQWWELTVFGTQPSRTLAGALPFAWISEVFHAGYLAYYPVIFVPSVLLFLRGERRGFGETVLVVTVAYTVCYAFFAIMPVQGPRYLWVAPEHVPHGPMRSLAVAILAAGSSRGAAFPSAHVAITVAQAVLAWRWQRRVWWIYGVIALLVGVGAVYGGFHYAIDVIAGAVVGGVIAWRVARITPRARDRQADASNASMASTTASTVMPSMQSSR
jgi:membrane-associated phospholipid phosphatase